MEENSKLDKLFINVVRLIGWGRAEKLMETLVREPGTYTTVKKLIVSAAINLQAAAHERGFRVSEAIEEHFRDGDSKDGKRGS